MAEGGTGPTSIQCGYCLVKDDQMNDPRVLPCSHVFCTSCMIGQYRDVGAVTCPICSTTFEGDVNSLPQTAIQTSAQLCDVCVKEDGTKHPAVIFCMNCSKQLCKEHQPIHGLANAKHTTISIAAFKIEERKLEIRYCKEHDANRYSLGCHVCRKVLCLSCVSSTNLCIDGEYHKLVQLSELESMLKRAFFKKCEDVVSNETNISKMYKKFSKMVSEYQEETGEMVSLLHTTRDEQIQAITTKYKLLEEELLQSRMKAQKQMETFMEEEVNSVLSALSNQRKRIEDKFRESHQVDVVLEHDSTLAKLKELADRKVKDCKVQHVKLAANLGSKREPEIRLAASLDIFIGSKEKELETWFAAPKSVIFCKFVNLPNFCRSICYVNEKLYIGTDKKTIEVVDKNFNAVCFAFSQEALCGIVHHDSEIYALSRSISRKGNSKIMCYNLSGQVQSSWNCLSKCQSGQLALVSNQLVVPDPPNKRIFVYSLSGKFIKSITGLPLSGVHSAMTVVDNNSVVVTCYSESSVFKVSVETGETMWTCSDVSEPHGVAVYSKEYVCVVSEGKLSFINSATGGIEKVINEPKVSFNYRYGINIMDIEIFDTTAVVSADQTGLNFFDFSL